MKKLALVLALSCLTVIGFLGCGDSVRNEQGVTFTFLGWYAVLDDEGNIDPNSDGDPQLFTGLYYRLDSTQEGHLVMQAGLQNNLFGEAIRLQRIHMDYELIGGTLPIPSTDIVAAAFLGPIQDNSSDSFGQGSTLPDSLIGDGEGEDFSPKIYYGAPILSTDLRNFLSLNRDSIPQRPTSLVVRSKALGVTTAGRQMETNELEFVITLLDGTGEDLASGASANANTSTAEPTATSEATPDATSAEVTPEESQVETVN